MAAGLRPSSRRHRHQRRGRRRRQCRRHRGGFLLPGNRAKHSRCASSQLPAGRRRAVCAPLAPRLPLRRRRAGCGHALHLAPVHDRGDDDPCRLRRRSGLGRPFRSRHEAAYRITAPEPCHAAVGGERRVGRRCGGAPQALRRRRRGHARLHGCSETAGLQRGGRCSPSPGGRGAGGAAGGGVRRVRALRGRGAGGAAGLLPAHQRPGGALRFKGEHRCAAARALRPLHARRPRSRGEPPPGC